MDIITLGCSKNLVDSEHLLRQFEALGYRVRHDAGRPDGEVVIVNTCGFIGDAKEESIDTILQLADLRKRGRIGRLYVMGCLSERYLKELEAEIPEVDRYYGKFNYTDIPPPRGRAAPAPPRPAGAPPPPPRTTPTSRFPKGATAPVPTAPSPSSPAATARAPWTTSSRKCGCWPGAG